MAISVRPISGNAISGDSEDAIAQAGVFKRKFRTPVARDRYESLDADAAPSATPEPVPTPNYDSLSPAERHAVDRLIVATRMAMTQGTQ